MVGCHNGRMTDPRSYFFSLVGGENVPYSLGILTEIRGALRQVSIEIQHDSGGNLRPSLYLPTGALSDPFGHPVDIEGGGLFVWVDRGGPYVPAPCTSASVPPQPPTPPTVDLSGVLATLAYVSKQIDDLQADLISRYHTETDRLRSDVSRVLLAVTQPHPLAPRYEGKLSLPLVGTRIITLEPKP